MESAGVEFQPWPPDFHRMSSFSATVSAFPLTLAGRQYLDADHDTFIVEDEDQIRGMRLELPA
jgi:hypothetical protein